MRLHKLIFLKARKIEPSRELLHMILFRHASTIRQEDKWDFLALQYPQCISSPGKWRSASHEYAIDIETESNCRVRFPVFRDFLLLFLFLMHHVGLYEGVCRFLVFFLDEVLDCAFEGEGR